MEGGDLASIHSPAENNFVASLIQDRPVRGGEKGGDDDHDHHHYQLYHHDHDGQDTWIAGQIREAEGEFSWMDGTPWDFHNWDVGGCTLYGDSWWIVCVQGSRTARVWVESTTSACS